MQNLIKMLIKHEGVRNTVYDDVGGIPHIGVGRNLRDVGLSDDEVAYLLENDVRRISEQAQNSFSWYGKLDPVRQEAVLNLIFNVGIGGIKKFVKAIKGMEDEDYVTAAEEFYDSRWATQVGQRSIEVCHMIQTGEYPNGFEPESE
jgi:lysozyme